MKRRYQISVIYQQIILNAPAMCNEVRVHRWQQKGNFTLVKRGRSWMPSLAQSHARSWNELHASCTTQIKTSGFPLCLYLCSHDYVCRQLTYAGCPERNGNFWRGCFTTIISIFKLDFFHSKIPRWGLPAFLQQTSVGIQCRKRTFWQRAWYFSLRTVSLMNN